VLAMAVSFVAVTVFSFSLLGFFISTYVTKPIESMAMAMKEVNHGYFKRLSIQVSQDEIGDLKDTYNEMILAFHNLLEHQLAQEKAMSEANFLALQEQIKPHFLYNTLQTIAALSLDGTRSEVYHAIETLGAFYRKFLSNGENMINLEAELDIVRQYIQLLKLRFQNRFDDHYEISDALLQVKVPRLILQPFVENAIFHGILPKGEFGQLKITATTLPDPHLPDGEVMALSIYDNGVGFLKERMEEVLLSGDGGYGFSRSVERLRTCYDRPDICQIDSQEGHFTEVKLYIPLTKEGA